MGKLEFFPLEESMVNEIVIAFKNIGWDKPRSIYEIYLNEQRAKLRSTLVAKDNGIFCGYVTIKWKSDYQSFNLNNIPKISDLNVLPNFRKKGIGTKLIQTCEDMVKKHGHHEVGLGVGMTADYGNAQRLYIQLGYLPDGCGLHYNNRALNYADMVRVDDDLVLYFTKKLI